MITYRLTQQKLKGLHKTYCGKLEIDNEMHTIDLEYLDIC